MRGHGIGAALPGLPEFDQRKGLTRSRWQAQGCFRAFLLHCVADLLWRPPKSEIFCLKRPQYQIPQIIPKHDIGCLVINALLTTVKLTLGLTLAIHQSENSSATHESCHWIRGLSLSLPWRGAVNSVRASRWSCDGPARHGGRYQDCRGFRGL